LKAPLQKVRIQKKPLLRTKILKEIGIFLKETDTLRKYGGFLKWWYPTNPGLFLLKMIHFGVFWGYHHLRKHPIQRYLFSDNNKKIHIFSPYTTNNFEG